MSIDEIKAAMADETIKGEVLEFMLPDVQKHLESQGNIIRTKEQDDSFINIQVEEKIKENISNIHKRYDDDVFEILGERKSPTQKTYEFIKEKLKTLKEKASSTGDQVDKDKLKELQTLLEQANSEKETAVSAIQEKYFKKSIDGLVSGQFDQASISLPPHLKTDEEKQAYVNNQKRMLKTDFLMNYTAKEDNDGNIVFYKGDKLQNNAKDGKPLTAAELIAQDYGQYFSTEGRKVTGAGTGKGEKPAGGFTTKAEVHEYLKAQGVEENTKAYSDQLLKLVLEHGIVD